MANKTVIITGSSVGLGYECAKNIARANEGWFIIIASRNKERNLIAVDSIKKETGYDDIEQMELDLASFQSVRKFATEFKAKSYSPLQGIICNAGVHYKKETVLTKDGIEATFGVNHLGHFLLVNLLLEKMTPPARIIFVSSDVHDPTNKTGMPNPKYQKPYDMAFPKDKIISESTGPMRYSTSKLCNIYCTYELSGRLNQQGINTKQKPITVNAFNPGMMPGSGLARDYNSFSRFMWKYILPVLTLIKPEVKTTKQSGKALARLLLDKELIETTSKYFDGYKEKTSSIDSYNKENALELWEESVKLVNLKQEETILKL
ncbi:MAG: dehydrogenase [Spirochaetes bacterium GWD1_27_9]|nr:MAG: dehydrogenase [Spirochaetes bacterium GWB1_27_13]OHD27303.1 MAG: dehydrogenase [Spirochaetes bacterium GWC1_27_15]OHD34165.1 MAG: dehydrogenase [Spirochaetes bacterium GWD1_27_9]